MTEQLLDVLGLRCPLPVLKARKRLASMQDGQLLTVYADDPGALRDIPELCRAQRHQLLSVTAEGATTIFRIRKAADGA